MKNKKLLMPLLALLFFVLGALFNQNGLIKVKFKAFETSNAVITQNNSQKFKVNISKHLQHKIYDRSYEYQDAVENCSTGKQKIRTRNFKNSLRHYCQILANDALNNHCAKKKRLTQFAVHCPGKLINL